MKRQILLVLVAMIWAAEVSAQPVMDGRLSGDEADYGAALSVQNTNTQFGDANTGDPVSGGGGSRSVGGGSRGFNA